MTMHLRPFTAALTLAAVFSAAPAARAVEVDCPTDLDGNVAVDVFDLLALLGQWGPCPGCPADFDGNDAVDVFDLLELLGDWGPCVFDYGEPRENAEAEQIGLEMLGAGGPLVVPDPIYDRVVRDLALIRTDQPALTDEPHVMAWAPNELVVKLVPDEPLDEYQVLNLYYEVTDEYHLFGDWWVLTFARNMNVPAMAGIYAAIDAVELGEPNYIIGGDNTYTPMDMGDGRWRWDIDDGFLDCFDGCDCHRHYIVDTFEDETVELILYEEYGAPWCEFNGK
jgi:hypothetical protein